MDLQLRGEAVHEAGELDPPVVQATDQLGELLLGGDHDPQLAPADAAEALHHGLQVEHLLHVAGDELAHLVDDEQQVLAGSAAAHQLQAAQGQVAGGDVGAAHGCFAPTVDPGIGGRVQLMHDTARLLHGDGDLALLDIPIPGEDLLVLGLEGSEAALLLQGDLQLGEVQVPGITQALQEEPVHDLGDALVTGADAAVGRDIEDNGLGGDLLIDGLEQDLDLRVLAALGEQLARALAEDVPVGDGQSGVLGVTTFPRPEEASDPDRDGLAGVAPGGEVVLEKGLQVREDRMGDDIFVQLVADERLVSLVDLDDLFDPAVDLAGEQVLDGFDGHNVVLRRSWAGSWDRHPGRP